MTIATKAELRTALGGADGLLHRTYTSAKLDEFILMGESRLNRALRLLDMIQTATGTLSTSVATLAIPARLAKVIDFRLTNPMYPLRYAMPSQIKNSVSSLTEQRQPTRYTVADTIILDAVADSAYPYSLQYFRGYQLAVDADTNYVLTYYPQAYMYASAIDAFILARQYDHAQAMAGLLRGELASLKKAERERNAQSYAQLETELAVSSSGSYNIDNG